MSACCCWSRTWSCWGVSTCCWRICCICWGVITWGVIIATDTGTWSMRENQEGVRAHCYSPNVPPTIPTPGIKGASGQRVLIAHLTEVPTTFSWRLSCPSAKHHWQGESFKARGMQNPAKIYLLTCTRNCQLCPSPPQKSPCLLQRNPTAKYPALMGSRPYYHRFLRKLKEGSVMWITALDSYAILTARPYHDVFTIPYSPSIQMSSILSYYVRYH